MARALPSFAERPPASLATPLAQLQQHPKAFLFQEALPTEIWRLVLHHVPTLDLFSLYNTSRYMRSLSATPLVQAMASKSLRLFFYQEYVRRVGVKFVFESFDLETDRVVFRPLVADNQYRFRAGMTLQNPQLEEVAVKSTGCEIDYYRVQCSQGRYYTIKPAVQRPLPPSQEQVTQLQSQEQEDIAEQQDDANQEADMDLGADEPETPEAAITETEATVTTTSNTMARPPMTISTARKRTADEKAYQGAKNFLDKACPIPVRKTGVRKMDGARYSFLPTYPFSLEYQAEGQQLGPPLPSERERHSGNNSSSGNGKGKAVDYYLRSHDMTNAGSSSSSGGQVRTRDPLETNRPHDEIKYASSPYGRMGSSGSGNSSGINSSSDDALSNSTATTSSRRAKSSPEMAESIADKKSAHARALPTGTPRQGSSSSPSGSSTTTNGPRFVRLLRFECSMNFLDPKRATRSVLGRWLEGKMQQWSKVLGGKRPSSHSSRMIQWQPILQQSQSQQQQQLRQQEKQKEKRKQKQLSLDRKRYQQPGSGESAAEARPGNTSNQASPTTVAVNGAGVTPPRPPGRRGRVIRAIDMILGPTDSEGSSVDRNRVLRHSASLGHLSSHSPSQSSSPNQSHSYLHSHHQGDASIAGGRRMIPAIDLLQMGSTSTSATF